MPESPRKAELPAKTEQEDRLPSYPHPSRVKEGLACLYPHRAADVLWARRLSGYWGWGTPSRS